MRSAGFDVVCHESQDGYAVFVPPPFNCSLYFECDGLTPVLMSCPSGLYFDSRIDICNWPEYVECRDATTTTSTSTTTTLNSTITATTSSTTESTSNTTESPSTTTESNSTTTESTSTTTELTTTRESTSPTTASTSTP